jgi:WD40 repeat protein
MAAGSCDKIIRVWNLHTAAPVAVLSRHAGMITAVNFCPMALGSNSYFLAATSGDGSVSFWKYHFNEFNEAEFEETPTR